jgi:hypothetical protein
MAAGAPNFCHLQKSIPARTPSCAGRDLTRRSLGPRLAAQTVQSPGRGAPRGAHAAGRAVGSCVRAWPDRIASPRCDRAPGSLLTCHPSRRQVNKYSIEASAGPGFHVSTPLSHPQPRPGGPGGLPGGGGRGGPAGPGAVPGGADVKKQLKETDALEYLNQARPPFRSRPFLPGPRLP